MPDSIARFMLDERGLETVEWAIVGGVIAAVGALLFLTIGADTLRGMTSLGDETALILP